MQTTFLRHLLKNCILPTRKCPLKPGRFKCLLPAASRLAGKNILGKIRPGGDNARRFSPVWLPAPPRPTGLTGARPERKAPVRIPFSEPTENPFMTSLPACPNCSSSLTYEDGSTLICPECGHEWKASDAAAEDGGRIIKDANGNVLNDGDTVTVIKDLKVKGSSLVVKVGTKVKNIRLVEGDHDIDCKIDGIGAMKLKSEFVKKA